MAKKNITVDGLTITVDGNGYLSLTDIAKQRNPKFPIDIVRNWLRNQKTLSYLFEWEQVYNENFKVGHMHQFRSITEDNSKIISPKMYIQHTGAIGIISKAGRYGGTYAHSDIALDFCRWLDPKFSIWVNKEFQRLKADEQMRLGDPYKMKRHLASGNYSILMASILSNTDERLLTHPQPYKSRLPIAAEVDMINLIVFRQSAKQWKGNNPDAPSDRNQRDFASVLDLAILNNLEFLDALLIQWDVDTLKEREKILQDAYDFIYPILKRSKTFKKLQDLADKKV